MIAVFLARNGAAERTQVHTIIKSFCAKLHKERAKEPGSVNMDKKLMERIWGECSKIDLPGRFAFVDKKITEYMRFVDRLKEQFGTSLEKMDIHIPTLVALGEQNAGKSSVLDKIVGVELFPMSDGFTTRAPIELNLRQTDPSTMN